LDFSHVTKLIDREQEHEHDYDFASQLVLVLLLALDPRVTSPAAAPVRERKVGFGNISPPPAARLAA
jgi:hypothetical protein